MSSRKWWVGALLAGWLTATQAAFVPPTVEQVKQAAAEPVRVADLVRGGSVQQAANVARDVIVTIVDAGLPAGTRDELIRTVIAQVFQAFPGQGKALAAALGTAIAGSAIASANTAVLSAIQAAVATATPGGGTVFGNAYAVSLQSIGGAPGGGKTATPLPPPPPVSLTLNKSGESVPPPPVAEPYEGQKQP